MEKQAIVKEAETIQQVTLHNKGLGRPFDVVFFAKKPLVIVKHGEPRIIVMPILNSQDTDGGYIIPVDELVEVVETEPIEE